MARPRFRLLRRLWWSAILVVVAGGGAGLAVHADHPHDAIHRPELFGAADADLQPWLPALDERLIALDERVFDLATAGGDLEAAFFSLDQDAALAAAGDGDAASAAVAMAVGEASVVRDNAVAGIERWRLSEPNRDRLSRLDTALESSRGLPPAWLAVSSDARLAAGILAPLAAHDELLTEATDAGRDARWRDAVNALDAAAEPLAEASAAVGLVPQSLNVVRLEALVAGYRDYDEALRALYVHIRQTDEPEGPEVDVLLAEVERLQVHVPMDREALGEVVVGALGQPLTNVLVAIEQASADVFDALPGEELEPIDEG